MLLINRATEGKYILLVQGMICLRSAELILPFAQNGNLVAIPGTTERAIWMLAPRRHVQDKLKYLAHIVSSEGISTDPAKIQCV